MKRHESLPTTVSTLGFCSNFKGIESHILAVAVRGSTVKDEGNRFGENTAGRGNVYLSNRCCAFAHASYPGTTVNFAVGPQNAKLFPLPHTGLI